MSCLLQLLLTVAPTPSSHHRPRLRRIEPSEDRTRPLHDRMPVILDPPVLAAWIDPKATPDAIQSLLVPYAGQLTIEPATL